MNKPGLLFNLDYCTGCATCQVACRDGHDLPAKNALIRIKEYSGGGFRSKGEGWRSQGWRFWAPLPCLQCKEPACRGSCPAEAISQDGREGIVSVDPGLCIGCGSCVESCPIGAITVVETSSEAVKCDLCTARAEKGLLPICVEACPLELIEYGEADQLRAKYPAEELVALPGCPATGAAEGVVFFRLTRVKRSK